MTCNLMAGQLRSQAGKQDTAFGQAQEATAAERQSRRQEGRQELEPETEAGRSAGRQAGGEGQNKSRQSNVENDGETLTNDT